MSYYLLKETLGYSTGLVDKSNPAPDKATEFETEKELLSAVETAEKEVAAELEVFGNPDAEKRQELRDKYTVKELKAILKEGGVSGYSKLNQEELVELVIENELG